VINGRFAAVLCRAERYIRKFSLKGPDCGALKAGERYIQGALYPGKTYIALMGFAQGTEGKERKRRESVISGERYIRVPLYLKMKVFFFCFFSVFGSPGCPVT